jgi:hypothetical protein
LPSARVRRRARTEALSTHLQRARVVAGGVAVADPPLQRAQLGHLREYAEGTHSALADPSLLVGRSHAARRWLSATVACILVAVVRRLSSVVCRPSSVVGWRPPSSAAVGKNRRVAARGNVACCVASRDAHTEALHRTACRLALPHGLRCGRTSPTARIAASASSALQPTPACRQLPLSAVSGFRKFPRSEGSGFGRFRISEGSAFGKFRIRKGSLSEVSDFGRFRFRKFPHRQWRG